MKRFYLHWSIYNSAKWPIALDSEDVSEVDSYVRETLENDIAMRLRQQELSCGWLCSVCIQQHFFRDDKWTVLYKGFKNAFSPRGFHKVHLLFFPAWENKLRHSERVTVLMLSFWTHKTLAVWDVWKGLNNKCFHATESAIMSHITLAVWSLDTLLISYNNCYHHFTITNPAYSVLLETRVIINSSKVMWHNVQRYNVHSLF